MNRVGVIGNGAWATALVHVIAENVDKVDWYIREKEVYDNLISCGNNPILPSCSINNKKVEITLNIQDVVDSNDILLLATPSIYISNTLKSVKNLKYKKFIVASKGLIQCRDHYKTISDFLHDEHEVDIDNIAIVAGPSHAEEVSKDIFTVLSVASRSKILYLKVFNILQNDFIRVSYTGAFEAQQLCGAMKNIYALGSGILEGLGYGVNTKAFYVDMCHREMSRVCMSLTQKYKYYNIYDHNVASLGDLLVTCYSSLSRNFRYGYYLGRGEESKIKELISGQIVEGIHALHATISFLKDRDVDVPPIIQYIERMITSKASCRDTFEELLKEI